MSMKVTLVCPVERLKATETGNANEKAVDNQGPQEELACETDDGIATASSEDDSSLDKSVNNTNSYMQMERTAENCYRLKSTMEYNEADSKESTEDSNMNNWCPQDFFTGPGYMTGYISPAFTRVPKEEHLEDLEKKQQDHLNQKDLMITKQQLLEEKLKFMEDLKFRAELSSRVIIKTPDDKLMLGIINAEGKLYGNCIICSAKNLRLTTYHCDHGYGPEWVFKVSWDVGDDSNDVYISYEEMSPENLIKALKRSGVVVQFKKSNADVVSALIYAYIFNHSNMIELPRKEGWFKRNAIWHWHEKGKLTMTEVMKRCT